MSAFLDAVLARAKTEKKTIVLPEGDDERTLQAAQTILEQGVADLIILGDAEAIKASASSTSARRLSARTMPRSSTSCASIRA